MPELPEVETMVRDLRARVEGRTIVSARVYWDRLVAYPDREAFEARVSGHAIETIERRGKFALFSLSGNATLAIHRGMTGSLFLRDRAASDDRFVRARFGLDNGAELRFDDSRKFGRLYFIEAGDALYQPPWARLGPEPLEPRLQGTTLARQLARRSAAIKTTLLNQSVVAGVGNIYADEALFVARIHPTRPANSLTRPEIKRLAAAISDVLESAIAGRGTTFSTYKDIDGAVGTNQHLLNVFYRHGQPCYRCGATVQRIVLGARGTHFCPRCQRLPKSAVAAG